MYGTVRYGTVRFFSFRVSIYCILPSIASTWDEEERSWKQRGPIVFLQTLRMMMMTTDPLWVPVSLESLGCPLEFGFGFDFDFGFGICFHFHFHFRYSPFRPHRCFPRTGRVLLPRHASAVESGPVVAVAGAAADVAVVAVVVFVFAVATPSPFGIGRPASSPSPMDRAYCWSQTRTIRRSKSSTRHRRRKQSRSARRIGGDQY